jgi:hypothetical protein
MPRKKFLAGRRSCLPEDAARRQVKVRSEPIIILLYKNTTFIIFLCFMLCTSAAGAPAQRARSSLSAVDQLLAPIARLEYIKYANERTSNCSAPSRRQLIHILHLDRDLCACPVARGNLEPTN